MHEASIAESVLAQVAHVAAREGLAVVTAVGVRVGDLSGVSAAALALAFDVMRDGPVLGRAALEVHRSDDADLCLEWVEGE